MTLQPSSAAVRPDVGPRLRRARAAVFVYFTATGVTQATWAVNLPGLKGRLDLDNGALGLILLAMAVGALAGMQAAGRVVDRLGSRPVCRVAGVVTAPLLVAAALAPTPRTLTVAVFAFGVLAGVLQVAANAQAVLLERRYARPIMSLFHALYSIGGLAGALVGSFVLRIGLSRYVIVPSAGVAVGVAFLLAGLWLLPSRGDRTVDRPVPGWPRRKVPLQAWLLGLVAAVCLMCEGAAADWSAVNLSQLLDHSGGAVGLGYSAFSAAMAAGRLFGDRLVARVGPTTVLRYGGGLAAAAFFLIGLGSNAGLVIAGWGAAGVGLCCIVPQVFSAAGNLQHGVRALALATTLGYLGLLAGPPLIGFVAQETRLSTALLIPGFLVAAVSAGARFVPVARLGRTDATAVAGPTRPVAEREAST